MALALSSLRIGKRYYLVNFGEKYTFTLMRAVGEQDFILKDVYTLEQYRLSELIQFGKGEDYDIREF